MENPEANLITGRILTSNKNIRKTILSCAKNNNICRILGRRREINYGEERDCKSRMSQTSRKASRLCILASRFRILVHETWYIRLQKGYCEQLFFSRMKMETQKFNHYQGQ